MFYRSPHGARVSGVVEETPGRLEYEVALYKEAPARLTNLSHNSELPVDQAVPIGTKLQLRARINPHSGIRRQQSSTYLIHAVQLVISTKLWILNVPTIITIVYVYNVKLLTCAPDIGVKHLHANYFFKRPKRNAKLT